MLLVPYQVSKEDYVIKKRIKSLLPTDTVTKIAYVGNKLSIFFRVKGITEFKHNHDIICQGICPEIVCNDHYLEATCRRISKRVLDYAGRNPNSHIFKHFVESEHPVLDIRIYKQC